MSKVHEIITEQLLEAIEKSGTLPWQKPWSVSDGMPVNSRGKAYRGINTFILTFAQAVNGYTSNYWVTPNQARKMGGSVTKGEKCQYVTFWKVGEPREVTDDETGVTAIKRSFILRYYKVVNIEQTEGCKLTKKMQADLEPTEKTREVNVIDEAEAILATYLAQDGAPSFAEDGGGRAYYIPATDGIHIPMRVSYNSDAQYYSTAFHEVGHSSGHSTRCKRPGIENIDHFGSDQYGQEELVAEMTCVMLMAQAGIMESTIDNSAAYLSNWKRKIKANPEMLVSAAGQAQKAADYILGVKWGVKNDD
jgi:antirestriction protein ArdC